MMTKIMLIVIIAYAHHPASVYRVAVKTTDECYAQAAILARAPPIDDAVIEYTIGCNFKEPVADEAL